MEVVTIKYKNALAKFSKHGLEPTAKGSLHNQGYNQTEAEGGGGGLYTAICVRLLAISFLSRFGDDIGLIIAILVVYHTGK